jgi:hypothetical protein
MKFRPRHLACLILLLSTLSGAEAAHLRSGDYTLGGHYITALLAAQEHAGVTTDAAPEPRTRDLSHLDISSAALSQHRTVWTPRPPAAHSFQLQAATSFAI